jgi:hypothetical protein
MVSALHWHRPGAMRDAEETYPISRFDKRRRVAGAELTENKAALPYPASRGGDALVAVFSPTRRGVASTVPNFFCNAAQSFGKEWETVCVRKRRPKP